MRDGYRVWDADTHVRPTAETLEPFLSAEVRALVADEKSRTPVRVGMAGEIFEPPYRHYFRIGEGGGEGWGAGKPRVLGEAGPREGAERHFQTFMGTRLPTPGGGDYDSSVRLRDMDEEGVDVHVIVHGGTPGHKDPAVDMEFVRAEHRYLNDFCGRDPHRLKSMLVVTPRNIDESIEEIKRWGSSSWAVAVHPSLPLDYPLDHPDLDPIWKATQEAGLCVVHHSFSGGYPGYRDLWQSPYIGRTASHPWAAMRAVTAFFAGGVMDRFPDLRYCILESGFGWLPFWAARMDDQAIYIGYLAEGLRAKPSEYMTSGRFFAGIVLHEGEKMVRMVTDQLGSDMLMFGSDYPHAESRFPDSANKVLGWEGLNPAELQKLLWSNAEHCFGAP